MSGHLVEGTRAGTFVPGSARVREECHISFVYGHICRLK